MMLKADVLKSHGYKLVEQPRRYYNVWRKPGCPGSVDVSGYGRGAMWYHRTGEPAKDQWSAKPIHSYGRKAIDLDKHLKEFHKNGRSE